MPNIIFLDIYMRQNGNTRDEITFHECLQSMDNNNPETTADATDAAEKTPTSKGPLSIGDLVSDRYEVLAHIGSGGMGEVYKVLDRSTQSLYALKMISPHLADQKTLAKRLEHEAQAARTLVHGNIVTVYDVGKSYDGAPYLIMDYIEGDSLEELLKQEVVLTPERALTISLQIAEALVHAAQKEVVHRDLKPSNVLMTKTPAGTDMVKIVDFGIAKVSDQDTADKTKLTQAGELLGTPLYMSPEQCTGEELDARSDIYSFGCIMYELLTGKSPYAAENQVKVILKHLSDDPPPLPTGAGISADLKAVVMRCLEKYRADRYQSAVELHIDLERIREGRKIRPYKRKRRFENKHKIAAAAAGFLLLAGTVGFVGFQSLSNHGEASLGRTQHRVEKYYGKTLSQWTSAIEKSPDNPELYLARGILHTQRDERTNAIDDFTQAINLKPDFMKAYQERAFMNTMIAQYDKGAQDANKIISLAPDSAEGYQTRGWVYGAREQYAEAMADWQHANAIQENPYNLYHLATYQLKLGNYKLAEQTIEKAIELSQGNFSYRGIAGIVFTFQQNYEKAYEELKVATDDPDARGVEWQLLAYYYVCVGNHAAAEHAVAQAKVLETFPARAFRLAGEYYRTAGQYDKAIQEFSASTSLEEYPPGYRERAVTYMNVGQLRAAFADLKKSLQLNPYSSVTLSYLAAAENQLGMKAEANAHMTKAFMAKALAPIIYVNRATMELNNGDAKKALEDANTAISRDPWLKEGFEARAKIRQKLNDAAGAALDRNKAEKLISHLDL
jgi:serine/threonine protein kinase